jgi:hypothetical protein
MIKYAGSISAKSRVLLVSILFVNLVGFATPEANAFGRKHVVVTPTPAPIPVPPPSPRPKPSATPHSSGGSTQKPIDGAGSCVLSDPNHICIGLKIVSYVKNGVSVLSQTDAIKLVEEISTVWGQCNIGFQLETYQAVDPSTKNLSYNSNWQNDGDTIRETFNDNSSFLVVTVGKLSGSTIGVTEMPDAGIYGSLIEDAYANNPLTVGHELGHYQGLYHVNSNADLMYAYIGDHTATLTADQCATARQTDLSQWQTMIRH